MNLGFHGFPSPGVLGATKRIFDSELLRAIPIRKYHSQSTGQRPFPFIVCTAQTRRFRSSREGTQLWDQLPMELCH